MFFRIFLITFVFGWISDVIIELPFWKRSSILRGIEFFLRHFHKQVAGREEEEEEEEERKPAAKNENNNAPNVSV